VHHSKENSRDLFKRPIAEPFSSKIAKLSSCFSGHLVPRLPFLRRLSESHGGVDWQQK
jgi:hypothetical protein